MIINLIAAMAANRVIGKNNELPRDYPQDLKHFRTVTSWHTIVMWRNTYESIWRPLPKRRNLVLTRGNIEWVECFSSIDNLVTQLEADWTEELFVIGGMNVYAQFIDTADYIYLTEIKKEYEGDTFFPEFEDKYEEVERTTDESGDMDFVKYKRK